MHLEPMTFLVGINVILEFEDKNSLILPLDHMNRKTLQSNWPIRNKDNYEEAEEAYENKIVRTTIYTKIIHKLYKINNNDQNRICQLHGIDLIWYTNRLIYWTTLNSCTKNVSVEFMLKELSILCSYKDYLQSVLLRCFNLEVPKVFY